jgi:hypothetical protein
MNLSPAIGSESTFMLTNVALLLQRFTLSYFKEGRCIEYFIHKRSSTETISHSLVFAYNPQIKDLHVSRFFPELYLQSNPKYLSAACFYLLIHHCANAYSMDNSCHISLETMPSINDTFYKKLKDFNFRINKLDLGNVVALVSDIIRLPVDTHMIKEHIFSEDDIPFLK